MAWSLERHHAVFVGAVECLEEFSRHLVLRASTRHHVLTDGSRLGVSVSVSVNGVGSGCGRGCIPGRVRTYTHTHACANCARAHTHCARTYAHTMTVRACTRTHTLRARTHRVLVGIVSVEDNVAVELAVNVFVQKCKRL